MRGAGLSSTLLPLPEESCAVSPYRGGFDLIASVKQVLDSSSPKMFWWNFSGDFRDFWTSAVPKDTSKVPAFSVSCAGLVPTGSLRVAPQPEASHPQALLAGLGCTRSSASSELSLLGMGAAFSAFEGGQWHLPASPPL